ncbi:MAG: DMT family transporter [Phycisphaerae bacterium]|nr:DMT family transporter [Phycisphaerae bacterium]
MTSPPRVLKHDALLLLAAFIWGTTFVAQRKGMDHVGPMTYSAFRFALGALAVLPLVFLCKLRPADSIPKKNTWFIVWGSGLAGLALFAASSCQQVGLLYTTAGKAGFITCLYVVIVPILGLFVGHRCGISVWLGAGLAVIGLYFLTIKESLTLEQGDLLELIGAFFWAVHVLWIGHMARRASPAQIACVQFAVCSILCFAAAGLFEDISLEAVGHAGFAIAYGGLLSAGVAFTLQIVSQRHCPPAHAAIIMSLETVFAAAAGWIILGETFSAGGLVGCALMLSSLMIVQLPPILSATTRGVTRPPKTDSLPVPVDHPLGQ